MNTESQTDQDRITQLEASCAAMREALAQSKGVLIKASNMHDMVKCSNFIDSFVMGYTIDKALSTDAGKSLLDRLQAVEKQHTALRLASEELITYVRHGDQEDIGEAMAKVESILQPAKEQ